VGSASPVPSRLILKSPDRVGKIIAVMVKVPNDTIKGTGLDWTGLDWRRDRRDTPNKVGITIGYCLLAD